MHIAWHKITALLGCLSLLMSALCANAGPPPPSINQCKSKWVVTSAQALSFGGFAIESGVGSLMMSNTGAITTAGAISLSTATPVTTFTATLNNTKSPTICGAYGFTISWGVAPAPLAGAGTAMALTNVLVSEPTLVPTPTALPVVLNTANLPITLTFQGDLATTFPQAAGLYTSPIFTMDLTQGGTVVPLNSTATATSLTPISIIETVIMDFGTVAGGSNAGTIVLNTLGARSVTGDGQMIATGPGLPGSFQITGEPNVTYAVLIAGSAILKNAGGQQITANAFTNSSLGTLPGTGIEVFQVGATLNLGALQAAGTYSTATGGGSPFVITVNYN